MKLLLKIVLLVINGLLSVVLIAFGSGYARIDEVHKSPLEVVIGILLISSLLILLILGKSNKVAEKIFWYLSVLPVATLLLLFIG